MELTDRQNWALSGVVGVLFVVNSVLWLILEDGLLWQVAGVVLAIGGLLATFSAIQAIRDVEGVEPMEWTTRKTIMNVFFTIVLAGAVVYWVLVQA